MTITFFTAADGSLLLIPLQSKHAIERRQVVTSIMLLATASPCFGGTYVVIV
jgi:hypothetical protein